MTSARVTTSESSTHQAPPGAAVNLNGLRKSFGSLVAVRDLALTIAPGEVVAVLGPNGAGKSTTIDMLLGLTEPDAGSVTIFGMSPTEAVRGGHVGAMLQSGALLPDVTVGEMVRTFAALHRKPMSAQEAMQRAGIADIAKQPTSKLSGGQMQRVRFALALVPDPDLLVLDEPTVAMDVEVRRAFWASMREFTSRGRTVLFATHYLEEADDFADRILVLAKGEIVADGTGSQIKSAVVGRTIRATVPGADQQQLAGLPGVTEVEMRAGQVWLKCRDSDTALRELLRHHTDAHDIEIHSANLEDAFLELTVTSPAKAGSRS